MPKPPSPKRAIESFCDIEIGKEALKEEKMNSLNKPALRVTNEQKQRLLAKKRNERRLSRKVDSKAVIEKSKLIFEKYE